MSDVHLWQLFAASCLITTVICGYKSCRVLDKMSWSVLDKIIFVIAFLSIFGTFIGYFNFSTIQDQAAFNKSYYACMEKIHPQTGEEEINAEMKCTKFANGDY